MRGTVLGGSNNFFSVECEDGATRLCSLKSKRLDDGGQYYNPLAPGDSVTLEQDPLDTGKGQIIARDERRNEFVRWNIKRRMPQVLAANLDCLMVVTTPARPDFRPRFVDRALCQAEMLGISPAVLCNKYDLAGADSPAAHEVERRLSVWEEIGYTVLRVSARTGEGLPELASFMEGRLTALVGQSGVGKSSIVNVLDSSCVLRTGSLSQKYGKGTHTTTRGTLVRLRVNEALTDGIRNVRASIIDTPGVKSFALNGIAAEDLALYFRELRPLLGKCAFGMSCTHTHESGCSVLEALRSGRVSAERFESWQRIRDELKSGKYAD